MNEGDREAEHTKERHESRSSLTYGPTANEWDATPHAACSGQPLQRWGGSREAGERRAVGGHDERQTRAVGGVAAGRRTFEAG